METSVDVRSMQHYRAALRRANVQNDANCTPSTLSSVRMYNLTSKDLFDTCIEILPLHSVGEPKKRYSKDEIALELSHNRMGATPSGGSCLTCGRGWETCPGHCAVFRIYRLIIVPTYAKHIVKLLNSIVCYHRGVPFPAIPTSRTDTTLIPVGHYRDKKVKAPRYDLRANGGGRIELVWRPSRGSGESKPRNAADATVHSIDIIRTLIAYEAVHGSSEKSMLQYWLTHAIPILPSPMRPKAGEAGPSLLNEGYASIVFMSQDVYFPNAMTMDDLDMHSTHINRILSMPAPIENRDDEILNMFAESILEKTPSDDATALSKAFTKIAVMILSFENRAECAARRICAVYDTIVAKNAQAGPLMAESPIFDSMAPGGNSIGSKYFELLLFNKDSPTTSSANKKAESGLIIKLGGKPGMFRNEAVSKRISHFARTTISPASEISSLSVNVPESTFQTITIKFICTPDVLNKAKRLLHEGELVMIDHQGVLKKIAHGRACATRACGTCVSCVDRLLQSKTDSTNWLIYFRRKLREGDRVIVNRQPSLSKRSIQGLTVVRDNRSNVRETMRLPVWIADAFNADYDGDEMNMVFPETVMADAEMTYLMHNQTNWHATMTPLQDSVFGLFLLGRDSMRFSKAEVSRIFAIMMLFGFQNELPPTTNEGSYTGFDVLHCLFDTSTFRVNPCDVFPGLPPRRVGVPTHRFVPCFSELIIAGMHPETFLGIAGSPDDADTTWGWGRTATPVMVVPHTIRTVQRHETLVAVAPYTLLTFGATGDACLVGRKDGCIEYRGTTIRWTVTDVQQRRLTDADAFLVIRCADSAFVSITGQIILAGIVRLEAIPLWRLVTDMKDAKDVLAGDLYMAQDETTRCMTHVRLCVASFPVTKKTLKQCKTFFSWYDDSTAVRMLDLFAAVGMSVSDMRGTSLSYDDFRIDTPHVRRSAMDARRMIQSHADELIASLSSGEYKQYVPVASEAYSVFCNDFTTFVYAIKNAPTNACEWSDLKLFTDGSLSKGDHDKLHEMTCMAGVRDINGSFPYGTQARSTHYFPERKNRWLANERGVIEPSYLEGIPPNEIFFEYNSSRTNIAKSHLEIKETGYNNRKMACAMVDLTCNYGGTVEDCGRIVLFSLPLFNPEFGSSPVDIRAVCMSAHMLESPRALSDDEIINGFLTVTKPYHQHFGQQYATTFLDACNTRGCSMYMRTSLFYKVRRLIVAKSIQSGFPLGTVASADITQSLTQSTLDAFHSTAGDTTASMGAKSILEQKKFVYPNCYETSDTLSKANLTNVHVYVCFRVPETNVDAWKAKILKSMQPRMLSDVLVSMSVVYHPWLTRCGKPNAEERCDPCTVELCDMMEVARIMGGGMERPTCYGSTLRFVTRRGLSLRDVYAVHKCLEATFASKPQCVVYWKHPLRSGDAVTFRLCIRTSTAAKAPRRQQRSEPQRSNKRTKVEEEEPISESDDESESESEASEENFESSSESESESSDSESEGESSEETEDDPVPIEEPEEEEQKPEKAPKGKTSIGSEIEAFDLLYKIATSKEYIHADKSRGGNASSRYIKAKALKAKTFVHETLSKIVWSGLPLMNSAVRFSDSTHDGMVRLIIPDCRLETLLMRVSRDMVIETIESTHHGNNTIMLGIEIATRFMRQSLQALWPKMPKLYIFLLVEHVSFTGRILSVNNHGVMQEKAPFNQMCFEKTSEYLLKGYERCDTLDSHVARTFFGMPIKGGTGLPDVYAC